MTHRFQAKNSHIVATYIVQPSTEKSSEIQLVCMLERGGDLELVGITVPEKTEFQLLKHWIEHNDSVYEGSWYSHGLESGKRTYTMEQIEEMIKQGK